MQGVVDETDVNLFKNGVDIGEEKLVRPADLVILGCKADVSEITLTITEGKFHQVKRMFEAVGKKVLYLKRISMGPLVLPEDLAPGAYRKLTAEELAALKNEQPKRNEDRMNNGFLPVSRAEMEERGIKQFDFVYVIGDAYVDHPSFGHAIISRLLEAHGYSVGIISQPDWRDKESVCIFGEPRLGFLVSAGNMDSMVNHYSVSKKRRATDAFTPGRRDGKTAGLRDHCLL